MHRYAKVAFCFVLLLALTASSLAQGVFSGPVSYSYDELGRLVGVVSSSGDAVRYSYDVVGNILSITRYSASQSAVFTFSPKSGPVGTNVTISGSNFSPNTAQDTVSFNGTNATIISTTTTTLVVAVPTGATTGTLTITSPAGTVTTPDSFTVTNSDGKPRITSFSPTIVTTGTAVAISGANFDTTPANDQLMVNVTGGLVPTSTTATSMSMAAPSNTGSGRISLDTPNGTVTSSGDLFIPPNSNLSSTVGATGRITSGTPAAITLSTANQIGLLLFDGKKGQRVSAVASGSTFGGFCTFSVYDPTNSGVIDARGSGSTLAGGACGSSGGLYDSEVLPATGTYTLMVSPGSSTGSATFTAYLFNDVQGNVTLNSPITATTSVPAQNMRYSLLGSVNQHISISITSSNFSSCTLSVLSPTGTAIVNTGDCSTHGSFIDVPLFSQNGIYTILLDPSGSATGSVTFKVNDATDVTGTILTDGTPFTVNTTVPGQNARLTFSGTAGQLISANFQNVSFSSGVSMVLQGPTGATVNSAGNIGESTVWMMRRTAVCQAAVLDIFAAPSLYRPPEHTRYSWIPP